METELISSNAIEDVSISEILGLASWDQPRTDEQIRDFISRREAEIADIEP